MLRREETHGEKVVRFDNSIGTVKEFNEIFNHCEIKETPLTHEVEIGDLLLDGEVIKREIFVNGQRFEHLFYQFPQLWKKYKLGEFFYSNIQEIQDQFNVGHQTVKAALKVGTFRDKKIEQLY